MEGGSELAAAESAPIIDGAIREGKAEVLANRKQKRRDGKDEVFYNPAQVFNRDLSVLVISVYAGLRRAQREEFQRKREEKAKAAKDSGRPSKAPPPPGLKILEALAATGIRSIRYAKELGEAADGLRCIVANDLDETAVAHIHQNVAHNKVAEGLIQVNHGCANAYMYSNRAKGYGGLGEDAFEVIDIDPYGSAAPFLDAAVQAVADGGLLCITSTDMPILGGNHPETCFARYGGTAIKAGYVHEMALRLLMHAVTSCASRYGREVRPLACFSIDFYVRIFVRVFDSPARVKRAATKTGVVHQCVQCDSFFVQAFGEVSETSPDAEHAKFKAARLNVPGSECPECKGSMKLGGPFYIGPLFDPKFVESCLAVCETAQETLPGVTSWKKITGMLTAMSEEHADLPLFYKLPSLSRTLKLIPMPIRQFKGTLISLGYRVSHFHREPDAIKTDAPNAVVYDLMRLWSQEHPPKNINMPELLNKPLTLKQPVEWKQEQDVQKSKVAKFLPNPEKNWGPKPRARGGSTGADPVPSDGAVADAQQKDADAAVTAGVQEPQEDKPASAEVGEPASKRQRTGDASQTASGTDEATSAGAEHQ